jgi:hypothetical protein
MVGPPSIELRFLRKENGLCAMKDQSDNKNNSGAGCLARFYWMLIGNALLAVAFTFLFQKHPRFPSFLDIGCLLVVASLVLVRYIDINCFRGHTGEGTPATMKHWRTYTIVLVSGSFLVWLVIRFAIPLVM